MCQGLVPSIYVYCIDVSRAHSFYICVFYICVTGSFFLYMCILYMCQGLIPSVYAYAIYVSWAHSFYICVFYICVTGSFLLYMRIHMNPCLSTPNVMPFDSKLHIPSGISS